MRKAKKLSQKLLKNYLKNTFPPVNRYIQLFGSSGNFKFFMNPTNPISQTLRTWKEKKHTSRITYLTDNFSFSLTDVLYLYDSRHLSGCFGSNLMSHFFPRQQAFAKPLESSTIWSSYSFESGTILRFTRICSRAL